MDRVSYDDNAPWPTEPDGTGPSLTRISVSALGNFAASWTAAVPTPGSAVFVLKGDVNNDGQVNGLDIDPFLRSLLGGSYRAAADMNQDGVVNGLDVDPFVISVLESSLTSTVFPLQGHAFSSLVEQPLHYPRNTYAPRDATSSRE